MNWFHMTLALSFFVSATIVAQDSTSISLPTPDMAGGKPLMQALHDRRTSREFRTDSIPMPVLSNLLWAACGINRPESGKRTAPSAMNWQEIDVYVATATGCYLYEPSSHSLRLVVAADLREKTGMQPFVGEAPVNLVFVADRSKMGNASEDDKTFYAGVDAGFVSQNVYLYCASAGLATVVRGSVPREALAKEMKLRPEQRIILAQTAGYPK